MKPYRLRIVLAISLLMNIGVFGTLAYRMLSTEDFPGLPRYLELTDEQLHRWHATEAGFLEQLGSSTDAVRVHRERLIRAIFAETPDPTLIDTERTAIARLQDEQQKQVIRQLLQERELLSPAQRTKLAQLLLGQPAGPSAIELLHRD